MGNFGCSIICKGKLLKRVDVLLGRTIFYSLSNAGLGGLVKNVYMTAMFHTHVGRDSGKEFGKSTLATDLAFLVEESSGLDVNRPKTRMEMKRSLELRIKRRVKEQYSGGKFQELMLKVVAKRQTLEDAYNCIRLDSHVDLDLDGDGISFECMAQELSAGSFDITSNTFAISSKGGKKEVLVLPNLKLKIIQEAIRIVLEVVYRPHFSRISHGCRSGRGHSSALKYICKEVSGCYWWFTLILSKKMDADILAKLISTMEEKINDPKLYSLLRSMFEAQVLNIEFGGFPKGHGLPQEGVLSPILINIYLDLFDREFYRLLVKYEALNPGFHVDPSGSRSKLRSWFRKHLDSNSANDTNREDSAARVHCCRFMDELFFAFSGSEDLFLRFKSETRKFLQESLHLNVENQSEVSPVDETGGVRFLGTLVKRSVKDNPALRAVHKMRDKVKLFACQRKEAWEAGTVRIGKKWLGHGLKKVKETEIRNLADPSRVLCQISHLRKVGMETDHWHKVLLKVWMQDLQAKAVEFEDLILSEYIAEPALPRELRDSFYEFQHSVDKYISSETYATLALLPNGNSSTKCSTITQTIAPVNVLTKRLLRYGLINADGYARASGFLVLQDDIQIIDWFSGIVRRWLRWYHECENFDEVKVLVLDQVRKSCIRTLAVKYRMHESEVEKRFDSELSIMSSTQDIDGKVLNKTSESSEVDSDEASMYGISYSGLCLLSLSRIVSQSRPCNCFVMGCLVAAPRVYNLHVMERQKFPGWKTGFSSSIHPSLNRRRIGLCNQHLKDLYIGHISLQSIDFGSWK